VGHEVLEPDTGHHDAKGEREVPVHEQIVGLVGAHTRVVPVLVGAVVIIVLLQPLLTAVRGDVEVVPPQRDGDDEPDHADGDRQAAVSSIRPPRLRPTAVSPSQTRVRGTAPSPWISRHQPANRSSAPRVGISTADSQRE
jgi:hypothetical protein